VNLTHYKVQDTQELSFFVQDKDAAPEDRMACIAFTELFKKELDRQLYARALNYSGSYAAYVPYSDFGFYEVCITAPPSSAPDISSLVAETLADQDSWLTSAALDGLKRRWKLQDAFQISDPRQRVRLMATEYELTGNIIDWRTLDSCYADLSLEQVGAAGRRFDIDNAASLSIGRAAQTPSAAAETHLTRQFDLV
jgi:predicted Zn-dependent peptidase